MNKKKTIQLIIFSQLYCHNKNITNYNKTYKSAIHIAFFTNIYIYNSLKNSHIDVLSFFEMIYKNSKLNV